MDYFDELNKLFEGEDGALFQPKPKRHVATADDRLIESFTKITQYAQKHGRRPDAEADNMDEAILGTTLNSILSDKGKLDKLEDYDELGLLDLEQAPESLDDLFEDDGDLFTDTVGIFDVENLLESKRVVENASDAAQRESVENFETTFKSMFDDQQRKLAEGLRKLTPFHNIDQLMPGNFYVYDGLMCFVSEFGKIERKAGGYSQQRITVIFANGTQSNMYRRSLAQRLYEGGTVVVDSDYVPQLDVDGAVGRIYVLSSLSEDPKVATIRDLYKIGVTKGSVAARIKNAANDPTYLMAPVKIIEDYRLTGEYNPQKVEDLIHQIFGHAKIDLQITAPDGIPYTPQEWYSVPLPAITEAIDLIGTGEIVNYHYDSTVQAIVEN